MNTFRRRILSMFSVLLLATLTCNAPSAGPDTDATAIAGTVSAQIAAQAATDQAGGQSTSDPGGATTSSEATSAPDASATKAPTNTPVPTNTTIPTNTPSIPIISVTTNTNCRYGPGTVYDPPVETFLVGETAEVYGRDADSNFYYISKGCWVSTNYVILHGGNLNSVPVMTSVATPTPTPTAEVTPWAGEWETDCGAASCGLMTFTQVGNTVTGTYAGGKGTINATVDINNENHLSGTWSRGGFSGTIDFWFNAAKNKWRGNFNKANMWCASRPGESLPAKCLTSTWYGSWETNCGASACSTMTITQDGVNVSGTYASGDGTVQGTVDGNVFSGTYTRTITGTFAFYLSSNGTTFQGNWNGVDEWCGYMGAGAYPVPCLNP